MADRPGMLLGGNNMAVQQDMLKVGDKAPDFELVANDMSKKTLSDYAGKVKIISCVPSLDTRVCAIQTRKFNEEAAALGDDIVILTVSADLPFAQKRWCGAEGIDKVETLSDHLTMKFADNYGVNVVDARILQRAVMVIDKDNTVQYTEYLDAASNEPAYDPALAKAKELV